MVYLDIKFYYDVLGLKLENYSNQEISKKLNIPHNSIRYILKKFKV